MRSSMHAQRWFVRLSLLATILTLCVVSLGAYVRLSDAGLGCPDWPGCYGSLTVPQSEAAIAHAKTAYPESPLHHGKAWKEMAHRYLAGTLGLLILALFVLGWRARHTLLVTPWLPTALLAVVTFQAMLGMWTVTMLLKPVIVSAHLLGGMTTLAMLTWISHRHVLGQRSRFAMPIRQPGQRWLIRLALLVLFAQIFLGGWTSTNYAALACTDFPTCHGAWLPEVDFANAFHLTRELGQSADGGQLSLAALTAIQWSHRIGALCVFLLFAGLALYLRQFADYRGLALVLATLLVLQIGIGIANLLLHLPLVLAVAHNLGAALLVICTVVLNSKITALKAV
ncbi:COX15/CtaA family protein [Methylobacillus flagellatus]|uniref:COX15/CtaA family protein n=1 Tax=Methylobacillus flagellatus TaxID=405 RepID=UPI0025713069|nr:COX15/CtaA family protein [Methylobacillus flagellatus]